MTIAARNTAVDDLRARGFTGDAAGLHTGGSEAEQMSLPSGTGATFTDQNASAGTALLLWSNTTATIRRHVQRRPARRDLLGRLRRRPGPQRRGADRVLSPRTCGEHRAEHDRHNGPMARDDDLPRIEVVDGQHHAHTERTVVSSGGDGRRWWVIGVGLLAAVLVGAQLRSPDGGEEEAAPPSTTTSVPPSTAGIAPTTTPADTEGRYLVDPPRALLGTPVEGTILLGSVEDGWAHLDPDTGWVEPVPALGRVEPEAVAAVSGGVVVTRPRVGGPVRLSLPVPEPGGSDTVHDRDFSPETENLARVVAALPTGAAEGPDGLTDRVWLVSAPVRPTGPDLFASLVDLGGRLLARPFPLTSLPVHPTASGLVVNAGGRSFLLGPDGARDLGPGQAFASSRNHVGRVVCDAELACRQEIVDLGDGTVVVGAAVPTDAAVSASVTMAQADDGAIATLPTRIPAAGLTTLAAVPSTDLLITRPDGWSMQLRITNPLTAPVWLPGGRGLVVLTGLGLVHVTEADGALESTRIPELSPGGATSLVVVPEA